MNDSNIVVNLIIDEIIDNINFEDIHNTMKTLHWTYAGSAVTPNINELKATARYLLNFVSKSKHDTSTSTGGFKATKKVTDKSIKLTLEFIIQKWVSEITEED